MGGGGFMKHASDTNNRDKALTASRRSQFKGANRKTASYNENNITELDFSSLSPAQIKVERQKISQNFIVKKRRKQRVYLIATTIALIIISISLSIKKVNLNPLYTVGQPIDSLNHVVVYYNGGIDNVEQRNTIDGYNLGLEYQCVEFVKRYYYEYYNHKMPDSYGHAKSFFQPHLADEKLNVNRGLYQFNNHSSTKPQIGDLLIFDGTIFNKFGHVAIVSMIKENSIEIIQQNAGPFNSSRSIIEFKYKEGKYSIMDHRILGWLRK